MKRIFIYFVFIPLFLVACGAKKSSGSPEVENDANQNDTNQKEAQFCALDAKECPDGSYVSRDPLNNCEFRPCPPPPSADEKTK